MFQNEDCNTIPTLLKKLSCIAGKLNLNSIILTLIYVCTKIVHGIDFAVEIYLKWISAIDVVKSTMYNFTVN